MSKQTIGLVRHGLTDWNALGKIQGQTDIPLNDIGQKQASLLAERLVQEHHPFDAVISSGLQRAEETARIIATRLQIPLLQPVDGLRERAYGLAEGTTPEEREQRWGADWRQCDLGQESDEQLQKRSYQTLNLIADRYSHQNLLLVTHGGWLAQLFKVILGDDARGNINNLSYSILERADEGWTPILYNCTKHMQPSDEFVLLQKP